MFQRESIKTKGSIYLNERWQAQYSQQNVSSIRSVSILLTASRSPRRPVKTQITTTPSKRPSSRAGQMDLDDDSPVPKARGLKRKNEVVIMSSEDEEEGPPRKKTVKDRRTPKAVPQTKRKSVLDLDDESEDELVSTKKTQEPSPKKGPPKTKPRPYKIVDSESEAEMTHEGPKKAGKPAKKKEAPSKKTMREDKKAEGKQKSE